MIALNGKYATAKVFTDVVDEESISQVINLVNQEFVVNSQIRMMPDIHAGAGCTIGTTMTIKDKVVPNLVGVDIGCLDKETEVLTPDGWIKISEYDGQSILVYDKSTDSAYFSVPMAYIKKPCNEFYHFHSGKGLDQMLSSEHKMLVWRGYKNRGYKQYIETAKDVFENHNEHTKSNRAIKTTFSINNRGIDISDNMIRIMVACSADGSLRDGSIIEFHLKKSVKYKDLKHYLKKLTLNTRSILQKTELYL